MQREPAGRSEAAEKCFRIEPLGIDPNDVRPQMLFD
jgi:hypothetical protein